MANIGYIRMSMSEENSSRQLEDISLDQIFEEQISGTVSNRPILKECMNSFLEKISISFIRKYNG